MPTNHAVKALDPAEPGPIDDAEVDLPTFHDKLQTKYHDAPPYNATYRAFLNGLVPGARRVRGRWRGPTSSVAALAARLGLKAKNSDGAV